MTTTEIQSSRILRACNLTGYTATVEPSAGCWVTLTLELLQSLARNTGVTLTLETANLSATYPRYFKAVGNSRALAAFIEGVTNNGVNS